MAALSIAVAIGVGGCGSGSSSTGSASTGSEAAAVTTKSAPQPAGGSAGGAKQKVRKAKRPTSRQARELLRSFPPPKTEAMEPEAASAVEEGEAACAGLKPVEVKKKFLPEVVEGLSAGQMEMIGQIGKYEAKGAADQSFVAGQLAADVYAATLPHETSQAGYQGCVYALAQDVGQQPAKKQ